MNDDQQTNQQADQQADQQPGADAAAPPPHKDVDGLKDKKPEELTPEELRLMADTMPGEGPGD
ncbi:hypothetical protein [uncultured Massilia sp.]|uniref:hypothetical protein n=1 Tax=uncultured Massilia sp. TaxID=169973 RepID=UPI0025D5F85C|nr:hypothetical protein [uncultured Massilia sp.]